MADLDGDGHVDLLSGSWPGEIFLFKGGPGRTFAAPVKLRHRNGKAINVGGGRRDRTGTASAVHAADWDGDGDLDLLVGEIRGSVSLVPNQGTKTGPAFGNASQLRVGILPLKVNRDAGPFTADWDGDGDLDLLVGGGDGAVHLYRNAGGRPPQLGAAEQLVPPGDRRYGADAPTEPVRGHRSKVCAADWNGDGRLDLLVGDITTQKPVLPPVTVEERAAQDAMRKELDLVRVRCQELSAKRREGDEAQRKRTAEELGEVARKWQELQSKLPREYENHGWVWLFLRKAESQE